MVSKLQIKESSLQVEASKDSVEGLEEMLQRAFEVVQSSVRFHDTYLNTGAEFSFS